MLGIHNIRNSVAAVALAFTVGLPILIETDSRIRSVTIFYLANILYIPLKKLKIYPLYLL